MQCLQASSGDLSVLERQIAHLNWQQQQKLAYLASGGAAADSYANDGLGLQRPRPIQMAGHGEEANHVDRYYVVGQKRKAESSPKQKQENSSMITDDSRNKRIKEEIGANSEANRCLSKKEGSADDTSKENSQQPKTDYIHVRARRGQATDSHSLAERVRRERISERMKYLQELVPGCDKITGKAGMLDEIINYVQSLQRQVEFLSMKLAAVNPGMDLNLDTFFSREIQPFCNSATNVATTSSDQEELPYLQFNNLAQINAYSAGLGMDMGTAESTLRRATSAPLGMVDPYMDSCFSVYGSSAPESNFNNIYNADFHQGKAPSFLFHLLQGSLLPNHLKM